MTFINISRHFNRLAQTFRQIIYIILFGKTSDDELHHKNMMVYIGPKMLDCWDRQTLACIGLEAWVSANPSRPYLMSWR